MNSTQTYLDQYYLDQIEFADRCELLPQELAQLVAVQLIPAPSYVVNEPDHCDSVVFGKLSDPGWTSGLLRSAYFHPAAAHWTRYAATALRQHGEELAKTMVKARFAQEFTQALAIENANTYRLPDCFDEAGCINTDGMQARVQTNWQHFVHGVFSLCVAKPDTIANIVHKEIVQEKLTALSDNGKRLQYDLEEREHLLALIEEYAAIAMPFSPLEFAKSSRKRLVDDLRARLIVSSPVFSFSGA